MDFQHKILRYFYLTNYYKSYINYIKNIKSNALKSIDYKQNNWIFLVNKKL